MMHGIASRVYGSSLCFQKITNHKLLCRFYSSVQHTTATEEHVHTAKRRAGLIDVEPVKGTRDFVGEDMRVKNWLFEKFRTASQSFAFHEYDAPILESEELYTRKGGEEITQQVYNFKDKANRPIALRPEMTPSLARIILKMGSRLSMPLKWFSLPQCWRFEQTTKGRKREHYQWNMDIIGVPTITAEVELLAAIVHLCKSLGLTASDVGIKVSNRKLLQSLMKGIGVEGEKFLAVCIVVDKFDKLPKEEMQAELLKMEISREDITRIMTFMETRDLEKAVELVGADSEGLKEIRELFALCEAYGFKDWVQFDPKIVRGLAYYTGIVFEAFAKSGSMHRAICGGGRYDALFEMYGASAKERHAACGFGFGDIVLLEILKEKKLIPNNIITPTWIDDVVAAYNSDMMPAAMEVTQKLRQGGRKVDLILNKNKNLGWCFSDKVGANRVVLVAPTEWGNQEVKVKYLRETDPTKKEAVVKVEQLLNHSP